ncbi:AAA family ATPase [Lentzea sp. BCCO 10_0856]|uniref:AAA family ATPase n=1 Tax=Lentzea miocenica TaxID=3095431 RepID=A0ABU4ST49_9PSEU|nr:AAA family ATPase [Lentzea sp. BCCO 10_0856]MDX8029075.1 AAA family ATPase [Lentzea sp. BCCO 10_0856]
MRDLPDLTFRGALGLLGHHDRPVLDRLNKLLGGVIMIGGAVALGAPVAAPLVALAAMWGFVDQKNEAFTLVRSLLDGVGDRRSALKGYDRTRLIAAAHTVLAASAVVEAFRDAVGPDAFKSMKFTETELAELMTYLPGGQRAAADVYDTIVPTPSSGRGFEENSKKVLSWQLGFVDALIEFCSGINAQAAVRGIDAMVVAVAAERIYRDRYREMAAKVPEFQIWALLNEDAATRSAVVTAHDALATALADQALAMSRLESMLTALGSTSGHVSVLHQALHAELDQPVVPRSSTMRYLTDVRFPLVREIFVRPRYRQNRIGAPSFVADEQWWKTLPVHDDLDVLLTAHLASVEATRLPMLVLGHPGAGKSLLMKVLTARLPADQYTTIYVPLRHVSGAAPIHEQIDEALRKRTHGRVEWSHFVKEDLRTTKVVILDGLDEMLQASERDRANYLNEVADFQWRESTHNCPVVVIVTSRTLVIDRVHVPPGTTSIKLEDFSADQIEQWRQVWNSVNQAAIDAGTVRELSPEAVQHQPELARQPLLLLLLALYSADKSFPAIASSMSRTALYRTLFDNFTRRESTKLQDSSTPEEQIAQLSVAALGMFNRGRQHITDRELADDLAALGVAEGPENPEQRLVAQFFFVYTAEADVDTDQARRSYEFLHATFGEYLVAQEIVETLIDTVESAVGRRGAKEPDDSRLFALLSHDSIATRTPVVEFALNLLDELTSDHQARIRSTTTSLITNARRRQGSSRYQDYCPVGTDHVREIAAYTANLMVLGVASGPLVRIDELIGDPAIWRGTLDLWRAGLAPDSWHALLGILNRVDDKLNLWFGLGWAVRLDAELEQATLAGDLDLVYRLEMGRTIREAAEEALPVHRVPEATETAAYDEVLSWLVATLAFGRQLGYGTPEAEFPRLFAEMTAVHKNQLLPMTAMVLKQRASDLTAETAATLVSCLLAHDHHDAYAYMAAVAVHPGLLSSIPELRDPDTYRGAECAAFIYLGTGRASDHPPLTELAKSMQKKQLGKRVGSKKLAVEILNAFQWKHTL